MIDLILRVWYDDIIKYFMALIDLINILSYIFLYVLFDDVFAYWITVEDVQECLISRLRLIISSLNISTIYTPRNKKEFTYYYWLHHHNIIIYSLVFFFATIDTLITTWYILTIDVFGIGDTSFYEATLNNIRQVFKIDYPKVYYLHDIIY